MTRANGRFQAKVIDLREEAERIFRRKAERMMIGAFNNMTVEQIERIVSKMPRRAIAGEQDE